MPMSFVTHAHLPVTDNPFRRMESHLVWHLLDIVADSLIHSPVDDGGLGCGGPETGLLEPGSTIQQFQQCISDVRAAKDALADSYGRDWVLTAAMKGVVRRFLAEWSVSAAFDLEGETTLSPTYLRRLVDQTRQQNGQLQLIPADFAHWIACCHDHVREFATRVPVVTAVDELERWIDDADRHANYLIRPDDASQARFRPFPADLRQVETEIRRTYAERHDGRELQGSHVLEIITLVARDERTRVMTRSEIQRALSTESVPVGETVIRHVTRELYLRGYARNGRPRGPVDDNVRPFADAA